MVSGRFFGRKWMGIRQTLFFIVRWLDAGRPESQMDQDFSHSSAT